ncbi:MAG: carboxypeptidase-like regulatory domain-containing protein [Thermoproteota archaeon]
MKQDLNHLNIRKICSIATILAILLAVAPLAVMAQHAYPPGPWKFKIADDWGNWGSSAAAYDPVTGGFGAVAYLYNSTEPIGWPGDWTFENWPIVKWGEADADGWVTIPELPGDVWDNPAPGRTITYQLIIKLKIRGVVTPITIYNATALTISWNGSYVRNAVGLYDLIHDTVTNGGTHPTKPWITGVVPDFMAGDYAGFNVWMYYIAMQLVDEAGFPITGAQLRVLYDSSYLGITYIKNTPIEGWLDKPYGTWVTNGTLGSEFIPDTDVDTDGTIYEPNPSVGWVILRVPRISPTTGAGSSLVNEMTFVWLYKTNTTIAVTKYYEFVVPTWDPWVENTTPLDLLMGNAIHIITAQVEWTGIRLLDCNGNDWWTLKAEVYGFDAAYKNQYQLMATRVAPGTYLLRYPVPVPMPVVNYDFETGLQGWGVGSNVVVSHTFVTGPYGGISGVLSGTGTTGTTQVQVDISPYLNLDGKTVSVWVYSVGSGIGWLQIYAQDNDWTWVNSGAVAISANTWTLVSWIIPAAGGGWDPTQVRRLGVQGGMAGITFYLDDFDWPEATTTEITIGVEWYYSVVNVSSFTVGGQVDELEGSLETPITLTCNMTWVDVNFWSETELPQQASDFAAKIWLPSTIGFRKAEPITVWWNGRNGFVVLPDMEWYAGPNPSTYDELDPYDIAGEDFEDFWQAMSQYWGAGGGFGGNGWLPTRAVGWVDFEAWYEGMKVLDTYADGDSLKLPCCETVLDWAEFPPDPDDVCHYNLTLNIYEIGWHIILDACGNQMDAPTGVPFFFKHPSPDISAYGMIGPKSVTNGKVDVVKAPTGNYSNFAIVWHMSLLRPYKILYLLDNGTTIELQEPIELTGNMRNIQLYFKLWNLTIDTWSQDPFRLVNVDVTLFSVSNFGLAQGIGISKRQLDQITDPYNIAYQHVLPPGWTIYHTATDEYGYPEIYYHTDTQTNTWNTHPSWDFLPEKNYWIWVRAPEDEADAVAAGFRRVDANATLYWSGDPWNEPLYLDRCYGSSSPLRLNTYVYNPRIALKTACGEPLVFGENDNSALILAEPWADGQLFYMQQIDPSAQVAIGGPEGPLFANYNAYLVRKNATDSNGVITLSSVNATPVSPPNDPDLWNPTTEWVAKYYPNQSRYLIGYSAGSWPILESVNEYRLMVYYKGVLVYNETTRLTNPYVSKQHVLTTSVYPYVFRAVNTPLPGEDPRFGVANLNVTVFWAGLNTTWWPTKHLAFETAPIEFSLLNASKLLKSFNMSVVKRLWGPKQLVVGILESIPYQPVPPYFSSMVVFESKLTDANGKATFLIPVWNYSISPKIYTWMEDDGATDDNLVEVNGGPTNPWNKAFGPLSINLLSAGDARRIWSLFGTPVYANFTTVPGVTNNIPAEDVVRPVAYLTDSKYCRWIQTSMNATGLVNTGTDVWPCVSWNTTYRDKSYYGGVGLLVGGAYHGRTPDSETGTTVSPPQPVANCYAKAEEKVPANDLGVVVRNLDKVGLPNQKVTVVREAIYIYVKNGVKKAEPFDDAEKVKIADKATLLEDWTPTKPNADPSDYYALYLRSTPSNILWGLYDVTLRTENLTRGMSNTLLKLNDPQFLTVKLPGGAIDWSSDIYHLDWPARLRVTILTEDGRPIEKAWVYVMDGYSRGNVTAAITDDYGHAGTLKVAAGDAVPPLKIEPGDRVDIGFNLLRGWFWIDADKMLTGEYVNPDWAMGGYPTEVPESPDGDEYIQYLEYPYGCWWWPDSIPDLGEGWARFYGRYYIVVYYKPAGCSAVQGPVMSEVIFDSYSDEPQHQYIYLGVPPETWSGEASFSASQAKTCREGVHVSDLRITFQDAMNRPLTGVSVSAKRMLFGRYVWEGELAQVTQTDPNSNTVTLVKVPLRSGTSYTIHAEWASRYGTKAVVDSSVKDMFSVVTMPVYDVTLRLVTPRGSSLVGVGVKVAGVDVGATSATGEVLVTQIPSGTYAVSAKWLDTDLNVPSLVVTTNGAVTLTPSNVHRLTVVVRGAQGQALEGATVRVTKGTVELTKLTDKDGKAEIELPDASYDIAASYGQFTGSSSVSLTADTVKTINLDVFIEVFGVGMSMAQFLLFIVMIIVIVIVLAIVLHEYHIYRRKKLPQLFGAPAGPK